MKSIYIFKFECLNNATVVIATKILSQILIVSTLPTCNKAKLN